MITLNKDLAKRIIEVNKLGGYIDIVYDLRKEEEYSNLRNQLIKDIYSLSDNLTLGDVNAIINIVEEEKEYYIYDKDEIIEELFPAGSKKNDLIISAYNWIGDTNKIDWIINNVLEVPSNKYFYDKVDNLNNNYIISTVRLNNMSYTLK